MREAQINHPGPERVSYRRRFEDLADDRDEDAISFFFDLKLMLPDGLTASEIQRARVKVEHRLHRTVRKKDRIVWTADGFFLLLATTDPARAGAAAERIHQDVCAALDGHTMRTTAREDDALTAALPPSKSARSQARGTAA
jgi:hypothetical protein